MNLLEVLGINTMNPKPQFYHSEQTNRFLKLSTLLKVIFIELRSTIFFSVLGKGVKTETGRVLRYSVNMQKVFSFPY